MANVPDQFVMVLFVVLQQLSTSRVCFSQTINQIFFRLRKLMGDVLDVEKFVIGDINRCTFQKPVA